MDSNLGRWFEIYVESMGRAKRFYETVFATKLERVSTNFDMWSFPRDKAKPGCGGALVKLEGVKPGFGGTLIYFASDDCAVEEKRIVEAGGKIHRPKTSIGSYGFIVLAYDTEGNMFGVHSMW